MSLYRKLDKPWIIGVIYLSNIILFSIVYWLLLSSSFKDIPDLNFIQALYFSIVTVTTLGFGDIIPNLNSNSLLVCIIIQVTLGVLNIGLFLNSISNKISLNKEKEINERLEAIRKIQVAKVLSILKPIVMSQLSTLADIYKSTSTDNSNKSLEISPKELMNDAYFDQVCLIDYFSMRTKYGSDRLFAQVLIEENDKFQSDLDNFLGKFAYSLDIELLSLINDIQNHRYFNYPKHAMIVYQHNQRFNNGLVIPRHLISMEHSKRISANMDMPLSMRDYHAKLLSLIDVINEYLAEGEIRMQIHLLKHISPPVGSAIARMNFWQGENQMEIDKLFPVYPFEDV